MSEVGVDVLGLAGGLTQHAGGDHIEVDLAFEGVVLGHRDHIVDADGVKGVTHLAGLPLIDQRRRQPREQAEPAIGRLEQYRAAVGTSVRDVEGGGQRPVEKIRSKGSRNNNGVLW